MGILNKENYLKNVVFNLSLSLIYQTYILKYLITFIYNI